jgi:hypothetical protein
MWNDVHREIARQRHADRLREAAQERLAVAARPPRRELRLRLGRLQLTWCPPPSEAHETG